MARTLSKSVAALLLLAMALGTSAASFESLRRMEQNVKQLHNQFKNLQPRRFGAKQAPQVISSGSWSYGSWSYEGSGSFSPQCLSAQVQVQLEARQKCGDFEELGEIFDVTSNNTLSLDKVCSNDCQSFLLSLQSRFPSCISADATLGFKLINSMCAKENGQYCAQSLKSVQKIDCAYRTQSECSSGPRARDCAWKWDYQSTYYSYGHCEVNPTNDTLTEVCTPCLNRFVLILGQQDSTYTQSIYHNYQNVLCSKQGNMFCYPLYANLDSRVWDVTPSNTLNLTTIQSNVSTICNNSNARRCLATVTAATVNQDRQENNADYISCVRYSGSYPSYLQSCVTSWVSRERDATALEAHVNLFCSTNAANKQCLPLLHNLSRSPIITNLGYGNRCTNVSAGNLTAMIADAGCCLDVLNSAQHTDFDPSKLPITRANVTVPNATQPSWTTNPVYYYVASCASVSGFNATVQREAASVQCPVTVLSAPPQREVRLIGVLWEPIRTNATLQIKFVAACVSDISAAIGVSAATINCSVVEDSSQRLTSSLTRRASSESSGAKFQFTISGTSDADAAENAQAFDTLQANSALTVPSTASTVSAQCSNCLAAGVSNTNLYAGLTGQDTSGTNPPTSSAAALSALSAVFAAMAVTLLL